MKLHAQLKAEGFAGSYSRVTAFVRAWRARASSTPWARRPALRSIAQTIAYTAWPLQLFEQCIERYGDPFTLSLPGSAWCPR